MKRSSTKKFTGLIVKLMVMMMVITLLCVPQSSQAAVGDKITDKSTVNEWMDYFMDDAKGTEFAGGIWTDKSVFGSGSDFINSLSSKEGSHEISTRLNSAVGEDNFLVSMSALATNKEIVGYSTVPTDTIFVLDVSNSMDSANSVPDMVNAANEAIDKLLALNKNNRIGIVLYSGNTSVGDAGEGTGMVLLELNRYTKSQFGGKYITYSGHNDTTIEIAQGLRVENGNNVEYKEKNTAGGTYIQNGLHLAMQEFLKADTVVGKDNIQAGEKRMPMFVLMSDGAPTVASTSYMGSANNDYKTMGSSNIGDGTQSSAGMAFLTQLTAAHAKEMVEEHYDGDAGFYTLGLNLGTNNSYASSVMNPGYSLAAINEYWNKLFTYESVTVSNKTVTRPTSGNGGNKQYLDKLEREDQNYVDRYFDASNNDKLEEAFSNIVSEIILQSAYYPTYIEGGERDLSGYISFDDDLGHFMEVKELEGILLGDQLFTGETIAQMMKNGEFGSGSNYTEKGWELVESLAERIGVDENVAITLLQNAWNDRQLYYENSSSYSNYLGWYEGANGEYKGFWSKEDGKAAEEAAVNNGAKYITKSYCYYGAVNEDGLGSTNSLIVGSDMMHVIIKVRTEIATGHQGVVFEIPASLIPLITYNVTLDAPTYEAAKDIEMEITEATPIRLLFEVGLNDEINEYNLQEVMAKETHKHPVTENGNPTGEYYFYSNMWGYGKNYEQLNPTAHDVTVASFVPSLDNERYYYTEDSVIYQKVNGSYVPYTGNDAPQGDQFYRAYRTFKKAGSGNSAEMVYMYEKIAPETLSMTNGGQYVNIAKNESGEWFVKRGTVRRELESYHIEKDPAEVGGLTKTLRYSRYAVITENAQKHDYTIYSYLGNNGRIKMTPATGIKLTKEIDNTISANDGPFEFEIQANINQPTYVAKLVNEDMTTTSYLTFNDGKARVTLVAGETVYISGLPTGEYTIREIIDLGKDYAVSEVTVDGVAENGKTANDTIEQNTLDSVVFRNTESKDGDLIVRKNVENDIESAADAVNKKGFTINVKLTDANGAPLEAGTVFATVKGNANSSVTLDENGSFDIVLKHNESVRIKDIPEGTKYIVTEPNMPKGFDLATAVNDLAGAIVDDETARVTVVNDYNPTDAPDITVKMSKTVENITWPDDVSFSFHLGKLNKDGTWGIVKVNDVEQHGTTTSANPNLQFTIPSSELNAVGTYQFRVHETNPNAIPGITSDAGRYITVVINDTNGDGVLEIESVRGENVVVNNDKTEANLTFRNVYNTTEGTSITIPVEKHISNDTGVEVSLEGYEFELWKGNDQVDLNGDAAGKNITSNVAGEAEIHLSYTPDEFNALKEGNSNTVTLNYTLKEKNTGKANVSYDTKEYDVTVVLRSEDGKLFATTQITENEDVVDTAVFTNTFDISGDAVAKLALQAKKNLEGRKLEANEFNFNLYKTGADFVIGKETQAVATGTNAANGTIEFDADQGADGINPLTYDTAGTYYYVAKEVAGNKGGVKYSNEEYYVIVRVTYDESDKKLVATKSIVKLGTGEVNDNEFVFNNEYDATPISVTLNGTKSLIGKDMISGDFKFQLKDKSGEVVAEATNASAALGNNNKSTSAFTFPAIKFTEVGTYEYTITEVNEGKGGYTYDDTCYKAIINVVDNGEGALTATKTLTKVEDAGDATTGASTAVDNLVFENSYRATPTEVHLNATKLMENRNLENGEFNFGVYAADANFNEGDSAPLVTARNTADGTILFDTNAEKAGVQGIEITKPGNYYYVVKEIIPNEGNEEHDIDVVYDEVEHQVEVIAWDNNGQILTKVTTMTSGIETNNIVFSNIYFEPAAASLDLWITKTIDGRELINEEFSFGLYRADANYDITSAAPIETIKNGEKLEFDNIARFTSLKYNAEDMEGKTEKTFYYVVKEMIPDDDDKKGVTYDNSQFRVAVTVINNGENELVATKSITKVDAAGATTPVNEIVFNNGYTATAADLTLGGNKTFANKVLKGNDFDFQLFETGETYATEGLTALATAKNDANGKFGFDKITYSEEGTHYYVVKEAAGNDAGTTDGQVEYDAKEYQIEVKVYDNGHGELEMDVTYDQITKTQKTSLEITDLNFTNGYNPHDAKLNLSGKKILEGRDALPGEFTFALYETDRGYKVADDAAPIQTKVNGTDNTFAFDTIVYDTLGVNESATHYYVVKEVVPADTKNVTYDTTEHKIKVVVKNDGEGKLMLTVDGETFVEVAEVNDLDFTNTYTEPPLDEEVDTGDNFNVLPFAIIALVALVVAAAVLFRKKK